MPEWVKSHWPKYVEGRQAVGAVARWIRGSVARQHVAAFSYGLGLCGAALNVRYRDPTQMGKVYLAPAGVARPIPGMSEGEQGPDADDSRGGERPDGSEEAPTPGTSHRNEDEGGVGSRDQQKDRAVVEHLEA